MKNPLDGLTIHEVKLMQMAYLFGRVTHEVVEPVDKLETSPTTNPTIKSFVEGQREAVILLMGDLIRAMREAERWKPSDGPSPASNFYEQVRLRKASARGSQKFSTQGGQINHFYRGVVTIYDKVLALWAEIVDHDTMMYPDDGIEYAPKVEGK